MCIEPRKQRDKREILKHCRDLGDKWGKTGGSSVKSNQIPLVFRYGDGLRQFAGVYIGVANLLEMLTGKEGDFTSSVAGLSGLPMPTIRFGQNLLFYSTTLEE